MTVFHASNFGRWAENFTADLDGFVATTPTAVAALNWEETLTEAMALEIATANADQLVTVEMRLEAFRDTRSC